MENRQSAALNLNNQQIQIIVSGILGDGSIVKNGNNYHFKTSCKYPEYIKYKYNLLGNLKSNISFLEKNGFAQTPITILNTQTHPEITKLSKYSLIEYLDLLDDFGLALWFYDDGSLHKNKLFYNLNTQNFSQEENEDIIKPFLEKFNIYSKVTKESKKDGRVFYYQRISKYTGSYEISKLMRKYYVECFDYKIWSSETIQKWSKLQEELKSLDKPISNKMKGVLLNKIVL